ncbi:MAG: type III pantothenate kinase [Candidatus Competibacteraceae bacterium]|nr:type III pantothenate kinase [Candidatus Competibacteraceae bacterium]
MMFLIVDQGNTVIKWTSVMPPEFEIQKVHFAPSLQDFLSQISFYSGSKALICSVANDTMYNALKEGIERHNIACTTFSAHIPHPLINGYETPNTLGPDRLADAIGAWHLFPCQNSLVIDFGSCNNYELVLSSGTYMGGGISPGLQMRLKALHDYTGKLPTLNPEDFSGIHPGLNTKDCILSATLGGILAEAESIIHHYDALFGPLNIIFTGGNAPFFGKYLKIKNFAHPDLVLTGLAQTLKYHFETK